MKDLIGSLSFREAGELNLVKGQKVRITDGVFKGVIGEFVRIRHDRRVVVNIEGVMAVATTLIPPSLVEPLTVDCLLRLKRLFPEYRRFVQLLHHHQMDAAS